MPCWLNRTRIIQTGELTNIIIAEISPRAIVLYHYPIADCYGVYQRHQDAQFIEQEEH